MTRVLFVAPSAYPLGGVATWLDYACGGLLARGFDVKVGLTSGHFHDVAKYRRGHGHLPIIEIRNVTGSRLGRIEAIAAAIRQTRPDIVLSANIADCFDAMVQLRATGTIPPPKLLMTIHGIQPDLFDDVTRERDVLDGVACSNRLALALARDAGVSRDRLHYIPYGVPMPVEDSPSATVDRTGYPLRIAYVGRIEQWQKRVFDIAAICDQLVAQNVAFEFLIAGAGPDEVTLREQLVAHMMAGRVRWLGQLSADEVAKQVYTRIDVLLNTSYWETGPIVVWEAMAHNVAVVSSRYVGSGLEAALKDGQNCKLFDIGNTSQAAQALASLVSTPARAAIAFAARELVANRYSTEASVAAWDDGIRRVLSQPPLRPVKPRSIRPAGRLDRLLGVARGERVRRAFGISFKHEEPGGEWPHSYGETPISNDAFWQRASKLDLVRMDQEDLL